MISSLAARRCVRKLAYILLLVLPLTASARCVFGSDKWNGPDKQQHEVGGALIGWVATLQTDDPVKGFVWAAGVGALKEGLDATGAGTCSGKDLLATMAGGAIGAFGGGLFVRYAEGKAFVGWSTRF